MPSCPSLEQLRSVPRLSNALSDPVETLKTGLCPGSPLLCRTFSRTERSGWLRLCLPVLFPPACRHPLGAELRCCNPEPIVRQNTHGFDMTDKYDRVEFFKKQSPYLFHIPALWILNGFRLLQIKRGSQFIAHYSLCRVKITHCNVLIIACAHYFKTSAKGYGLFVVSLLKPIFLSTVHNLLITYISGQN